VISRPERKAKPGLSMTPTLDAIVPALAPMPSTT
jgi:hypothetical protein